MSTLADELLNDFEDSGSDGEGEQEHGILRDVATPPTNGAQDGMILDGDEEAMDDEDEEAAAAEASNGAIADAEDEEEAHAKVEKMRLGGVSDVRNVAGLMKTLEPVLEVSSPLIPPSFTRKDTVFTFPLNIALTFFVAFRKSPLTRTYH